MIEIKANYPKDGEIFIPERRELPKADIPAVELTEREAAERGWSFRKKTKSVRITNYHGGESRLVVPSRIGGLPVNEIGGGAFAVKNIAEPPLIERVMIPDTVRKLGEGAFSRSEVRSVVFGDGLTAIPKETFFLCRRLENVRLPAGLLSIGESAFRLCEDLRYIILPESLRDIGEEAFFRSGLEGFAANNRVCLGDGQAFAGTRMHKKYKLILHGEAGAGMDVFLVGAGAEVKFPRTVVTLCRNAVNARCALDFSECENVFSNDAFFDKRDSRCGIPRPTDVRVILPAGVGHVWFPPFVSASYADGAPYPYMQMLGITEEPSEKRGGSVTLKPRGKTLPSWSVDIPSAEEIRIIHGFFGLDIEECAFKTPALKRLEMHDVSARGRIFSPMCRSLREVSWVYIYDKNRRFIPPAELIGEALHEALLAAFREWKDDKGWYQFRYFVWDKIFAEGRVEYAARPAFTRRTEVKRLTQRDRVLIALDVLRSTREHNEPTDIYAEYLRTHRRYAKLVCEKIKDKYPEYLRQLTMDNG